MKRFFSVLLIVILAKTHAQGEGIQDSTFLNQINKAKAYIDFLKTGQDIPSISIAVGKMGKLIWAEAFGLADRKNKTQATLQTKYRIGSIGKTITALTLGKLYDEGLVDFDKDITPLIPKLNTLGHPLTIRQLAGHQGGIRHYKGFEFYSSKQYTSIEESLEIFIKDGIEFEPGTRYLYSTYGYVLLSRIIEIVTKNDYLSYMSEEILKPLNMSNTVVEDANMDESNLAKFYAPNGKREVREVNVSNKWGGGAFLSTPSDLATMVNNSNAIIDTQTLFELATPQKLKDGKSTGYGMGFRISRDTTNDRFIFHHGGKSPGARAFLLVLPAEQIVIAICANSQADFGLNEVYKVARIFIK